MDEMKTKYKNNRAAAQYRRLDGNMSAVSKLKDGDMGTVSTMTRPHPKTGIPQDIQVAEKSTSKGVADFFGKEGYSKVSKDITNPTTGYKGSTTTFSNDPKRANDLMTYMSTQPIGTHYIVTSGSLADGHAFNIVKTKLGVELLEPQNEFIYNSLKKAAYKEYISDVFSNNMTLWTK